MKCRYCGHEIPEGKLYCDVCGEEVCIVPDYNPLEEMLTQQIRGAINGEEDAEGYPDYREIRSKDPAPLDTGERRTGSIAAGRTGSTGGRRTNGGIGKTGNSGGRRTNSGGTGRTGNSGGRRTNGGTGRTGKNGNSSRNLSEQEKRRRQAERKKVLKRKRRLRLLIIMAVVLVTSIVLGIIIYQNSYTGMIQKGNKALTAKDYDTAAEYFQKAVKKDQEKADAYIGLAKIYIAQDDLEQAEAVFLDVIDAQPKNADVYEACVNFYLDTEQAAEIPVLLEDADDSVRELLAEYVVDVPEFSLEDDETFDDVQELSLSTKGGYTIYYTTDDTEVTVHSTEYTEPIQIGEDETVVRAIAVNKKGIPSLEAKKTYVVELPIEDAPVVSPSTGQYESAMQIEVKVPDGYEAYYTMNGEDPTTASTKYNGPIDMPEGETLFKAILVNGKGRVSGITTRNYVLDTE